MPKCRRRLFLRMPTFPNRRIPVIEIGETSFVPSFRPFYATSHARQRRRGGEGEEDQAYAFTVARGFHSLNARVSFPFSPPSALLPARANEILASHFETL